MPKKFDIFAYRGDELVVTLTFPNADMLEGDVLAQVRCAPDADLKGAFEHTINGTELRLTLTPDFYGDYVYDIQVGVTTYVYGKFHVEADVSK